MMMCTLDNKWHDNYDYIFEEMIFISIQLRQIVHVRFDTCAAVKNTREVQGNSI